MVVAYAPRFYHEQNTEFRQLLYYVKNYGSGGVMIFQGKSYAVLTRLISCNNLLKHRHRNCVEQSTMNNCPLLRGQRYDSKANG